MIAAGIDWSAVRDFVLTLPLSFTLLLVLAWLAARLLGTRQRSWVSAVVAASAGVLFGALLLSAEPRRGIEEVNVGVVIVVQVLATMAATVVLDLLSDRPSTERPMVRVPHPVRGARAAVRRGRRYVHVLRIASRRGLAPYLGLHGNPANAIVAASSVRGAMEEAGGMFVKLGQLLAGRADLLPAEVRREFSRLQEQVAPADAAAVEQLVETELGAPLDEVFAAFELEPIAAASIGQAHAAKLQDGTDVIIKVQRPGIDTVVEDDLATMRWLAHMAERRTAWGRSYRVAALADEFANALREELDFRAEARNVREAALALADQPGVVVPHAYTELSTRRVLVLERVAGDALSDLPARRALADDARKLGDALLRAVVAPMMTGERFHADPHPGNVRVLPDGRLALIDFGATGRLDAFEQASVTDILLAVREGDPSLLLDAVRQVAIVRRDVDERQLEHALAHFLARHVSPAAKPDASMLTELLQVFLTFGIALPAGTTTMFRALVTLQGTLECLCPGYPVIDAAQELASTLVMSRIEPSTFAAAAQKEVLTAVPLLRRVPRHLDRIATQLENGDLRLQTRLFADPDDAKVLGRLVGQVVLVLAAATSGGLAIGLLNLTGGPDVTSGLSLHRTLGYAALMLALVLLLRAITTVLRESR